MKKYIKPQCTPICLDMEALVAGSYNEDDLSKEPNTEDADSRRRHSIWDDPFVF